ncbi:MAG TPA: hypothetical protein VFZ89_19300, partial [Solirubrobacteraceae bacterium]
MSDRLETRLADELDRHAAPYADLVLARIDEELPDMLADPRTRELGRDGSQALLREFASVLRHQLASRRYHAPAAAL